MRTFRVLSKSALEWARKVRIDRKSTRLNSSHSQISYAVFCLKKKKKRAPRVAAFRSRVASLATCAAYPQPAFPSLLLDRARRLLERTLLSAACDPLDGIRSS